VIERRSFASLGGFRNDWLNAKHHFSFGHYHDPSRMGVGRLRVWNDDEIAPGTGFDPHPHREMEIVTYIREGAITHKDSLGNTGRTEAGDVQVMHAGTGIVHAEYNLEKTVTRLFQIWILPDRHGVQPGWATRPFPRDDGGLRVLASGRTQDAGGDALPLNADAALLAGTLTDGQQVDYALAPGRALYLVPARGAVTVNGVELSERDGAAIVDEPSLRIVARGETELVIVEVAG
jgi:redox-sensitive bicupin YhaK (pirin superfamily)